MTLLPAVRLQTIGKRVPRGKQANVRTATRAVNLNRGIGSIRGTLRKYFSQNKHKKTLVTGMVTRVLVGGDIRIWITQGACYRSMIVADYFSFFQNAITFRACLCYWFRANFSRLMETIREKFLHVFKANMILSSCVFLILCHDFLVILCNFKMK